MRKFVRLQIESPVTVGLRTMSSKGRVEFGKLCDIGEQGARIRLDHPIMKDKRINLLVHFGDHQQHVVTLRFEAVVIRSASAAPYEIAVEFLGEPSFIRGDLSRMLNFRELEPGLGAEDFFLDSVQNKRQADRLGLTKWRRH